MDIKGIPLILPETPSVKLLDLLAQSYYCAILMFLATMAALVISIIHYRRHRNLRIFTCYIALSLLQDLSTTYVIYSDAPLWNFWVVLMITLTIAFVLFGFIACNLFILHYIGSPLKRRIIWINGLLYFGILIFAAAKTYFRLSEMFLAVLESIFLVPPCLVYFYELFSTVNLQPLKSLPAFWVVTGILFLNACAIPLYLTVEYLGSYTQVSYTLNYILFSAFFILLIRAYLCPSENPGDRSKSSHGNGGKRTY